MRKRNVAIIHDAAVTRVQHFFASTTRHRTNAYHRSFASRTQAPDNHYGETGQKWRELILKLPPTFLRESDPSNYDPWTHQRKSDNLFDQSTGKPLMPQNEKTKYEISSILRDQDNTICIHWADGHAAKVTEQWIRQQWADRDNVMTCSDRRTLWTNWTETTVRNNDTKDGIIVNFEELLSSSREALEKLHRFGLVLVKETPTDDAGTGIAALAAALSGGSKKTFTNSLVPNFPNTIKEATDGPLRTLYGTVWSTHSSGMASGTSLADSAYTNEALPLHTDMTYHAHPPGLQIFTMKSPAAQGGESVFADGFAVAERLRTIHPKSFDVLCRVPRRYRSIDDSTGWHLEAVGPIIDAIPSSQRWGTIRRIRHNDLDRLPDFEGKEDEWDGFYHDLQKAHYHWDQLLALDEFRLVIGLQPNETMVVANQRCFHGRHAFVATPDVPRAVMGCYVSQDELDSRFRRAGLYVP